MVWWGAGDRVLKHARPGRVGPGHGLRKPPASAEFGKAEVSL